jgi:FkbH-like protein
MSNELAILQMNEPNIIEPIRLIIWDLDETFWFGTLSEGGIKQFIHEHHDLIFTLSCRGIMNSICSKNDFFSIKNILDEQGIWKYFIFPSISWSPKGTRVRSIVESCQLRPESVLFIDDNPSNLAEVAQAVPGIITAGVAFIKMIAGHAMFRGKVDMGLTRLAQYKILEEKQQDYARSSGDNATFLRNSNIKVTFEHNVEAHFDRVFELLVRTNQLNFTKIRFSEDTQQAHEQILSEIRSFHNQAALIKVSDIYGDYGFCGFYLKGLDSAYVIGRILHFCFSCRILGMGIEQYVYDLLGRPDIHIVGDVVSNLIEPSVDWVNQSAATKESGAQNRGRIQKYGEIRLRGGCETAALSHYFRVGGNVTHIETNYNDGILAVTTDTSTHLINAIRHDAEIRADLQNLSYPFEIFETRFSKVPQTRTLQILNLWGDVHNPRYSHKSRGFSVHITVRDFLIWTGPHAAGDIAAWSDLELKERAEQKGWNVEEQSRLFRIVQELRENYVFSGLIPEEEVKLNLKIFSSMQPKNVDTFLVLPSQFSPSGEIVPRSKQYTQWFYDVLGCHQQCFLIEIDHFINSPHERHMMGDHFDRIVYQRVAQSIIDRCNDGV